MNGRIFDIQRFSVGNGPGIRTTVFLKGCSLRCRWCHNPESIRPESQLSVDLRLCRRCGACAEVCPNGVHELTGDGHRLHMEHCTLCGACTEACCYSCIAVCGEEQTPEALAKILLADEIYYRESGGGVTFSGGEPMLQWPFIRETAALLGRTSLYIDTCGNCPEEAFAEMLQVADGVLFDIKHTDPVRHRELTGSTNGVILRNLAAAAASGAALSVRYPMIPDTNDDEETVDGICRLLKSHGIGRLDISPYHDLGENKYYNIGTVPGLFRKYTDEEVETRRALFHARGIETQIV